MTIRYYLSGHHLERAKSLAANASDPKALPGEYVARLYLNMDDTDEYGNTFQYAGLDVTTHPDLFTEDTDVFIETRTEGRKVMLEGWRYWSDENDALRPMSELLEYIMEV